MPTQIVNFDRAALLLKDESAYGTDPTPDGTNDAILTSNGRIRFDANKLTREIDQAYLGARPFVLTGRKAFIEFDIEVIGAASAGDASPLLPVLSTCGHAEVLVASTSATYNPVSTSFDSGAAYFYIPSGNASGATQHVILGMRGSINWEMSVNGYAKGRAVLQGLEASLSDVAFPSMTLSAYQEPVGITPDNWTVTVAGFDVDCVGFTLDQGNRLQFYETSEQQHVAIVGRDSVGELRIMTPALSDLNPYALAVAGTKIAISSAVNGGANKISTIAVPNAQLELPEPIDIDGAAGLRIPFTALPTAAGNDEYTVAFT